MSLSTFCSLQILQTVKEETIMNFELGRSETKNYYKVEFT